MIKMPIPVVCPTISGRQPKLSLQGALWVYKKKKDDQINVIHIVNSTQKLPSCPLSTSCILIISFLYLCCFFNLGKHTCKCAHTHTKIPYAFFRVLFKYNVVENPFQKHQGRIEYSFICVIFQLHFCHLRANISTKQNTCSINVE